jgi:hypothetical protein
MLAIVLGQVCRCVVPCTALRHKLKLRYHGNADATPITFSSQAGGLTRAGQALSSPLLAMCCGMALASTGVLPQDCPAYDAVWQVGKREGAARVVRVCFCVCFFVCVSASVPPFCWLCPAALRCHRSQSDGASSPFSET